MSRPEDALFGGQRATEAVARHWQPRQLGTFGHKQEWHTRLARQHKELQKIGCGRGECESAWSVSLSKIKFFVKKVYIFSTFFIQDCQRVSSR